jgi:carboxylesterase type B
MAAPTEIRQKAIALLEQLPKESLIRAVEFLEALSRESLQLLETSLHQAEEAILLEIIQRRLSPEKQERLAYLRQQNENEIITGVEHQELLVYINCVEQQDAERAEALIKLAQLRQVDLNVLINEFLPTHSHVA